jgi:apolipoprotein N-acyltransferase
MTVNRQINNETGESRIKPILIRFALVLAAAVLFAASHPNILFKNGFPFFAWFAYIPALVLVGRNNIPRCVIWGAVYGCLSYWLFNYWLGTFHPMAGVLTYGIYAFYMAVVFLLFKLADIWFPKRAYLVQWTIWLAYEYLRTKGFLGYSYGITGYSQWRMIPLIQIASITGVWGVSALVAFPSFWLAAAISKEQRAMSKEQSGNPLPTPCSLLPIYRNICSTMTNFFSKEKTSVIIWSAALVASLIFGVVSMKDFSSYPKAAIALVQHNTDPWLAEKAQAWQKLEAYRKDLAILSRLSDEALASNPKPDLVVWPETAFIPRIYWHTTYRDNQDSWLIVRELLTYLSQQETPFLIGNDDARKDPAKNPNAQDSYRVDYNAALLYEKGVITGIYRKIHLVPFTEHFPYKKSFPSVYNALVKADTHFWEKGDEETVFQGPGFTFSTPICFEDTFGYLSRNFVNRGADILINLTNDAWANSLPAQKQHLAMSVFRAVENYRPVVRSAVSGQTCAVDPQGRVIAEAAPFTEAWLNVSVPIVKKTTFFSLFGGYFGLFFTTLAVILLLSGAVWCTMRKTMRN